MWFIRQAGERDCSTFVTTIIHCSVLICIAPECYIHVQVYEAVDYCILLQIELYHGVGPVEVYM